MFVAGYLAITRAPAVVETARWCRITAPVRATSLWGRLVADPTYTFRSVAALGRHRDRPRRGRPHGGGGGHPHADPILAQAVDGTPEAVDSRAPAFSLVDQHDKPVSLASLRGKTVALTFLDDTCTTDCPVIAQEFRSADSYLGSSARRVEMVAINANPRFITPDYLAAFDHQEGLEDVANWLYLTGSLPELRAGLGVLRRVGHLPARGGDDRPQRVRLGHRRHRPHPLRPGHRPGAGNGGDELVVFGDARQHHQERA